MSAQLANLLLLIPAPPSQVNFICIALNHSYSLKWRYRLYI